MTNPDVVEEFLLRTQVILMILVVLTHLYLPSFSIIRLYPPPP